MSDESVLVPISGCKVDWQGETAQLSGGHDLERWSYAVTPVAYRAPFTVSLRAKTDSTNIRLYWASGMVIFNWEVSPTELRIHDPATNAVTAVPDKGHVAPGKWHSIVWEVRADGMRIVVDDEVRYEGSGEYAGLSGAVGGGVNVRRV